MAVVQYVRVRPESDLFSPATRAFGNILVVGAVDERARDIDLRAVPAVNTAVTLISGADGIRQFPGPLGDAIAMAYRQTPGPSLVQAIRVDQARPDYARALELGGTLDVQFVVIAGVAAEGGEVARGGAITALVDHVDDVSKNGEDGRERMGVAMFRNGTADPSSIRALANDRMVYVAHKSDQDAAAAVAGAIAGYPPHISPLLKEVKIDSAQFTGTEIIAINGTEDFSTPPAGRGVVWLTNPALIPGEAVYLGEAYTGNAGGGRKYIDIVRTLDDISFRLKARLIKTIGFLRISRSGLRTLLSQMEAVLDPLVADQVIESYTITIPILVMLDKPEADRTRSERDQINAAQSDRLVTVITDVDYAGALHRLSVSLNLV